MKKLTIILMFGFVLFLLQGCTKENEFTVENENIDVEAKKLAMDENFNIFIENFNIYSSHIKDNFDVTEIKVD